MIQNNKAHVVRTSPTPGRLDEVIQFASKVGQNKAWAALILNVDEATFDAMLKAAGVAWYTEDEFVVDADFVYRADDCAKVGLELPEWVFGDDEDATMGDEE